MGLWLLATLATCALPPAAESLPLQVMSFNVRYGTAPDGSNAWEHRREALFAMLREEAPDVLGVQEALHFQLLEIERELPGYQWFGKGRDDGREAGEFAALFYRTARLTWLEGGEFWLSDTPETPGSATWGNQVTRICTWARFADARGEAFTVANTHFDHESQPSREKAAELILERFRKHLADPFFLLGDLNVGESNPALGRLRASGLRDTFRVLHPDAAPVGTFTGFDPAVIGGAKIDYVLANDRWDVLDAKIVRPRPGARLPSDHFPVTAVLRVRG